MGQTALYPAFRVVDHMGASDFSGIQFANQQVAEFGPDKVIEKPKRPENDYCSK